MVVPSVAAEKSPPQRPLLRRVNRHVRSQPFPGHGLNPKGQERARHRVMLHNCVLVRHHVCLLLCMVAIFSLRPLTVVEELEQQYERHDAPGCLRHNQEPIRLCPTVKAPKRVGAARRVDQGRCETVATFAAVVPDDLRWKTQHDNRQRSNGSYYADDRRHAGPPFFCWLPRTFYPISLCHKNQYQKHPPLQRVFFRV